MVMAAAASSDAPEENSFEEAKSRLEDVSRLHPPHSDNSIPEDPEYALAWRFPILSGTSSGNTSKLSLNLYCGTRSKQIENHLGGNADETKLDADGGNDG